jgi:hypothetical protein
MSSKDVDQFTRLKVPGVFMQGIGASCRENLAIGIGSQSQKLNTRGRRQSLERTASVHIVRLNRSSKLAGRTTLALAKLTAVMGVV